MYTHIYVHYIIHIAILFALLSSHFHTVLLLSPLRIWHSEDRASWYILTIKANETHYFSNLFWYWTLRVSDRSTVHHQEPQHWTHSKVFIMLVMLPVC